MKKIVLLSLLVPLSLFAKGKSDKKHPSSKGKKQQKERVEKDTSGQRIYNVKNRRPALPYISGDAFRSIADHVFDETTQTLNPKIVQEGDVIFCKSDFIKRFFKGIHPRIQQPYILISHNSDSKAPGDFSHILQDSKLIAWFAQNVEDVIHDKLHPIPIGIENQYISKSKLFFLKDESKRSGEKKHLAYLNFSIHSDPSRQCLIDNYSKADYITYIQKTQYPEFIKNMHHSHFTFAPRGNGWDTHRAWESLYLGSIPIVHTSASDKLFDDLPVLIVDSWDDISEEFLKEKLDEIESKEYNLNKLNFDYWQNLIFSYKNKS